MKAIRRWLEAWRMWRFDRANMVERRNNLWYVPLDQSRIDEESRRYTRSFDRTYK